MNNFKLDKVPYKRQMIKEQLYTGHLRVDMGRPIAKGNFVVMKGDKRASGKHLVAEGAVNHFLAENSNNRAVYVGLTS